MSYMPKKKDKKNLKNKAYKYQLYPDDKQTILINRTIGCARLIYNLLLCDKKEYYKKNKEMLKREVSYYKKIKKFSFLKDVDSLALANAKIHLETAYKNFFDKKSGFPKFKKKGINDSYTTNRIVDKQGHSNIVLDIENRRIKLPKIGYVKTKHKRFPGDGEKIKSVTISKKGGKYFASVLVEYEEEVEMVNKDSITIDDCIGLDYSSHSFYIDSNGNEADYPRYYRKSEKKLAKLQRQMCKKQKGSKRRYKQKLKVQKCHLHISNQRLDFAHKKSAELTDNYKVICLEDLNLSSLKKTLRLGKSTSDNGFGMFRNFCEYKANKKGGYVVKIDKFYPSSQLCHCCGYKNPDTKDLSIREWVCPNCGTFHNRDENAAINIRNEGYRMLKENINIA